MFFLLFNPLAPSADSARGFTVRELLDAGRYTEARLRAAADLQQVRATEGSDSPAATRALDLWIETRLADGDHTLELLALAEQALEVNDRMLDSEDPRLAESLLNYAWAAWRIRGDMARSRAAFERAVHIRRGHLGDDHPDTLKSVVLLAYLLRDMGAYDEAMNHLDRARRVGEAAFGPESLELSRVLSERGALLWRLDELEEARTELERAVRIQEKILGVHPEFASTINRLAIVEWAEGNYVEARALYERMLAIQGKTLRPDHAEFGSTWLNMGLLLWRTGDLEGAKEMFDRSYSLPQHQESPDHPGRGYDNYARLAMEMGDTAEALALMKKLESIRENLLGPNHPLMVRTWWPLGNLYREIGEATTSRRYLVRALSLCAIVHGPRHTRYAEILRDLALLDERTGDLVAARRRIEQAIEIVESVLGRAHPMTALMRGDLARIHWRQGRSVVALPLSLEAARLHRSHLARVAEYFSEREALSAESNRLSVIQTALSILAREGDDPEIATLVWDEAVRGRALVLDAIAARHRTALVAEDDAVAELRKGLEVARRKLARLFLSGPGQGDVEAYVQRLHAAREEKERLERRLAGTGSAPGAEGRDREVGLTEVRAALPRDAALVAFAGFDDLPAMPTGAKNLSGGPPPSARRVYVGLVLAPGREAPVVVRLGDAGPIDHAVHRWRAEVSTRPRSEAAIERLLDAGRRLRAILWDPIASRIGPTNDVFLVPEGAIHLVSFGTLPEDGGTYMVERLRFHYLSAERDLVPSVAMEERGRGLLALGGADFDADPGAPVRNAAFGGTSPDTRAPAEIFRGIRSACENFQTLRFPPLPGSQAEALELAELFRSRSAPPVTRDSEPVIVLTGAQAAEGVFKRSVPGRRIIHLATHGFLIDDACESATPKSGTRGASTRVDETRRSLAENPLLLSGVALSSANRRDESGPDEEDGVLTAEEAASLDLRGVEWAVLSGCGTGLGSIQTGEGVLGLRRAFRVAGARTLILSLWRVEDHAARQWFRHLYAARFEGDSTPVAVQRASLEVLQRRRASGATTHPFFWGAFVAAGDWQ